VRFAKSVLTDITSLGAEHLRKNLSLAGTLPARLLPIEKDKTEIET
jgi:hypothetical protein